MANIIDADTHIAEPREMWQVLEPEWYPRRPVVVEVPSDTAYTTSNHMWLIDGQVYPRTAGKGGMFLVTPMSQEPGQDPLDAKARELTDLDLRLHDMDRLGADLQVVYPTLFLTFLTHDVHFEVALCKAYNRFLADVYSRCPDRLRWVVVPPLRNIDATIREIQFGKAHGAVGVFFRGIEKDLTLDDPYFFPVYEEAQALNLSLCIHQGSGSPALNMLVDIQRSHTFTHGRLPPLVAFRNLVANKIPELFPGLRWGFIETGASWIPFVLHQLKGVVRTASDFWGPKLFEAYNMWISYEVAEDLPYLVQYIGEDHIVTGTDYGHHGRAGVPGDPSAQLNLVTELRSQEAYPSRLVDKLLSDNPKVLYGL
jgi:predicted TIM-barrel fold metal-dependent hydrolase